MQRRGHRGEAQRAGDQSVRDVPVAARSRRQETSRQCRAGEERAPEVHAGDGARLREADVQEAVVQVGAIRLVQRLAVFHLLRHHERGVDDRNPRVRAAAGRESPTPPSSTRPSTARSAGSQGAARAGVAHEDARRIEVVGEGTQAGAGDDATAAPPPGLRARPITAKVEPAIAQMPAARPSIPSRKLTMFMIATIRR